MSIKDQLKELKNNGEAPEWLSKMGYQTLLAGYLQENETPKAMYKRISKAAAAVLPNDDKKWEVRFFEVFWKGWLAGSTPILANLGTNRGLPVSCSGSVVSDTLDDIYKTLHENAILSKHGFGTAGYFNLRAGGSAISSGGYSNSILDWIKQYHHMQNVVSQGNVRRGSFAAYVDIDHVDYDEVINHLKITDKFHLGISINSEFENKLKNNDPEAFKKYLKLISMRTKRGKPYIDFKDRTQNSFPKWFKDKNLKFHSSQLCNEIRLPNDEQHTYSCVLASLNAYKYDEWKDTDAVETAIVFLDCICQILIDKGRHINGLEKIVRFTEKARALGLGLLGFHSYLQSKMLSFDGLEARFQNQIIFSNIKQKAEEATKMLAEWLGEPEWCRNYRRRNSALLAIAPNTSSALICGSVSQGIEPFVANYYIQKSAKGTMRRMNPELLKLLKQKNKYSKEVLSSIANNKGSVQHLSFLTNHEKEVFKTAYEINQRVILDLANQRQKWIDQGQSLNLFFSASESEQRIHEIHKAVFEEYTLIKGLYYVRTEAGIKADNNDDECLSCQG